MVLQGRLIDSRGRIMVEALLVDTVQNEKFWVDDSFQGNDLNDISRQIANAASNKILLKIQANNEILLCRLSK